MKFAISAAGALLAMVSFAEPAPAGAIFPGWPDAIVCTRTDSAGPAFGTKYMFLHVVNNATAIFPGYAIYRLAQTDVLNDFYFNADGSSNGNSGDFLGFTDCAGKSISQLAADGQTVDFGTTGAGVPAGAMIYMNLAACPSGWTRQVQLNPSFQPDSPMVLCRKD